MCVCVYTVLLISDVVHHSHYPHQWVVRVVAVGYGGGGIGAPHHSHHTQHNGWRWLLLTFFNFPTRTQ